LDPSTQPEGKLDYLFDTMLHSLQPALAEQPAELVYNNVEKFETFRKEVFRVSSKDMDCTVTANVQKEYLRQSEVEAWLTDMGVKTGNKFQTQMSKLKTLKHFYDFVCKDKRMEEWGVVAHKDEGNKLLLHKNPFAIFFLKNNGVTKAQYEQLTGIRVPADTPYAVSFEDQANLIIYWIVNIRMLRARKDSKPEDPGGGRLYAATTIRLEVCHLIAALNELEERLKALRILPDTYVTYLRGLHAKQGPFRKIVPALDDLITWCITQDPAVGQIQKAYTITDEDYPFRVSSLDYQMNFAWRTSMTVNNM
jgi:hypothetical protein